jgi:hypothetical protein
MPSERAGQGALPKSLILAYGGRRLPPRFLIIECRFRARGFPKSLIDGSLPALRPRSSTSLAWVFPTSNRGRGGAKRIPQISHTCACAEPQRQTISNDHTDIQDRSGGARLPQKSHSWRYSRPSGASGRPASRGLSTARQQGRGLGSPQIPHTCLCRRPGSPANTTPQIPHSSTLVRFRINRRTGASLPKSLIITPQIPHFDPQILHSYPESFPKFLIGVPKSFTINSRSL